MKYKYGGIVHDVNRAACNIYDLLLGLESDGEIETKRLEVYNIEGCSGVYTEDEIDELLNDLVDIGIIEVVN